MKKIILLFAAMFSFFCSISVFCEENEQNLSASSENSMSDDTEPQQEVASPYVEGYDDNSGVVTRKAQTDDTIDAPYGENIDDTISEESADAKTGEEDFAQGEGSSIDADDIVQSIYGVPEQKDKVSDEDEYGDDISSIVVTIPEPMKPKKADSEKLEAAKKKDEDNSDYKEKTETLKYGTPSEISGVVDKIVDEEDVRYIDELYELFYATNSNDVRSKILDYFGKQEDPCLSDYVVEILDDPYDVTNSFVSKCMQYATQVKCKEAAPALVKILEGENEDYFNAALSALGKTGGKKEAKYLAKYLSRDDLETPVRQALMRTLGQMNAEETWEQIVEIAQDEDENGFVRQYAAEAIGNMKKDESIPILINLYENSDPNMREYCIKGLMNYPDSENACNTILQGIRDDHVKVRLQSIKACREMKLKDAVDFLIYRAKNDNEASVKKETYPAIAELNTKQGNEFLIERITDKKSADSAKTMAVEALLKYNEQDTGVEEIADLAKEVVQDDRRKPIRKSLGRILAKYPKKEFAEVCSLYIASKDAETCGFGIDMYKSGRYKEAVDALTELANSKTGNTANRNRAKKLLGIEDSESDK